ncbi:MAG: recombinase RecA [Planctomycetota bacterium]
MAKGNGKDKDKDKDKDSSKAGKDDRGRALKLALDQIEKSCGKGAIMKLGDAPPRVVEGIQTGSIALDVALGGKGIPRGRIIEVYGPESSGKTTLALHVVANAQRAGGTAAFIDAEHALDPSYAERLGVKLDDLLVSQPDSGEQALEIADILVASASVDLIVIDSVAALVPRAELQGDIGDNFVGLQARMMSQVLRRLTGAAARANCAVIFINQLREKIGVMFGSPETTPGGRALKFYASVRIDVRRVGQIKEGENVIGNRTTAKVAKNKVAPPFKKAEFDILYNEGISRTGELIDFGIAQGIVQKSGSWFSAGDLRLGQGREAARQFLKDNPDVAANIETTIRKELVIAGGSEDDTSNSGDDDSDGDGDAGDGEAPARSEGKGRGKK